jgi:hypothetical protein
MVLVVHRKQLFPKQYGFGLKYHRDIRGGNIFQSIKKFAIPALGFLYRNILEPFWKNNKEDIIQGVTSGLKNIASTYVKSPPFSTYKEEIINPILNKMKEKSMNEHLRGDGIKKNKSKNSHKVFMSKTNRLTKKSKEIIKNLLKAEVS